MYYSTSLHARYWKYVVSLWKQYRLTTLKPCCILYVKEATCSVTVATRWLADKIHITHVNILYM